MSRMLWKIAPATAAGVLLLSLVVRWRHGSPLIPFAVLAIGCLTWAVIALVRRRVDSVSDQAAAAIDSEVHLDGELRSAAWFAAQGVSEPWAEFHLQHAATRLESIDFAAHYPPIRAPRARIATGVMIVATLVLAFALPQRPRANTPFPDTPLSSPARKVPTIAVEGLPPDLPQDLEDLLTAIENERLAELRPGNTLLDALNKLNSVKDPEALAALARALASDRLQQLDDKTAMKDLAERAQRDAAKTPSSDIREALDQLAKNLEKPDSELDSAGLEKSDDAEPNGGVDMAGATQTARDSDAIAGVGMIALSKQESAQSDAPPGVGAGGTSSNSPNGGGTMPEIATALRHEVVEAHEDDVSGDVHSEDRRKTEHGTAATAYSHSAIGHSDGSRAVAPPPVPEARRAGVQTYFTRKQ